MFNLLIFVGEEILLGCHHRVQVPYIPYFIHRIVILKNNALQYIESSGPQNKMLKPFG